MRKGHLFQQMEAYEGKGLNMQAVRIVLEHARDPMDGLGRPAFFREVPHLCNNEHHQCASCWITPKGFIWNIRYSGHSAFIRGVLGLDYHAIEAAGWIHVSGGAADILCPVTPRQERALRDYEQAGYIKHRNDKHTVAPKPYQAAEVFDVLPRSQYDWRDDRHWRVQPVEHLSDVPHWLDTPTYSYERWSGGTVEQIEREKLHRAEIDLLAYRPVLYELI